MHKPLRSYGLTLLELVVALAAAAIALSVGAPALRVIVLDAGRTTTTNAFIGSAQLARSTAIRRNLPVVICAGTRAERCEGGLEAWRRGWVVFVNLDRDWPARLETGEPVLHEHVPPSSVRLAANREAFRFQRIGLRATNGTLTVCDERGSPAARALIVSYTGRVRSATARADGTAIEC